MCTQVSAGEMLIDVEGNGNVMINIEMSVFIDVGVFWYNLFNTLAQFPVHCFHSNA